MDLNAELIMDRQCYGDFVLEIIADGKIIWRLLYKQVLLEEDSASTVEIAKSDGERCLRELLLKAAIDSELIVIS